MKRLTLLLLIFPFALCNNLLAQDTLPNFSVKNIGNDRIVIGWINTYKDVQQISIQRSFDSLSGYKTLLSVLDPTSPQNGYVDANPTNDHMFYRLYIMMDKGIFQFTEAKKPVFDNSYNANLPDGKGNLTEINPGTSPNINAKSYPSGFMPSLYVFTHRDGYVRVNLPKDEKPKEYSIKFFEEDGTFLFELKDFKERSFKIDKTNFYHAGWFRFELYDDDKLFERHKFFLEKDF